MIVYRRIDLIHWLAWMAYGLYSPTPVFGEELIVVDGVC